MVGNGNMTNFNKTFKNGLRVFLQQNEKDVVAISILFFVGSQNEQKHQQGYSHFIEHLNFKSSVIIMCPLKIEEKVYLF